MSQSLAETMQRELARQGITPKAGYHNIADSVAASRPMPAEMSPGSDDGAVFTKLNAGMERALARIGLQPRSDMPAAGENAVIRMIGANLAAAAPAATSGRAPDVSEAERERAHHQLLSCVRAASASAEEVEAAPPREPPAESAMFSDKLVPWSTHASGLAAVAAAADPNWRPSARH